MEPLARPESARGAKCPPIREAPIALQSRTVNAPDSRLRRKSDYRAMPDKALFMVPRDVAATTDLLGQGLRKVADVTEPNGPDSI
jgi:hypothetical protein